MHDYLEIMVYFRLNFDNINFHLLDVTVPTPITAELPPRKTGQHLKQIDLLKGPVTWLVDLMGL